MIAPSWAREAIKLGAYLDLVKESTRTDADVNSLLTSRNLVPVWYEDSITANPGQSFRAAQAAGALNPWPTTVQAFLFAPGSFVRLDGGSLDLGIVRDSTLNTTNDFQMFSEEWIGMAFLGCESIRLTSDICVSGAGPLPVTACCEPEAAEPT